MRAPCLLLVLTACAAPPASGELPWQPLVAVDWELQPGEETYLCARLTLDADVHAGGFAAVAAPGTHHSVTTIGAATEPDGVTPCEAVVKSTMLHGAGIGTNPLVMPDGIAALLPAGDQLTVNLHLVNATDAALSGRSGLDILRVDPADVEFHADALLCGPRDLAIPPGDSTHTGGCTLSRPATIFALQPHMHALGTHMTVTAAGTVVHDAPFDVDRQELRAVPELPLAAGDAIEVTCSYRNPTSETVVYGPSATDEMCFANLFRYPASTGDLAR